MEESMSFEEHLELIEDYLGKLVNKLDRLNMRMGVIQDSFASLGKHLGVGFMISEVPEDKTEQNFPRAKKIP